MKILLDECVTKHLKPRSSQYEVLTVREMGWSGIKNGKLMTLCVENYFQILLPIFNADISDYKNRTANILNL